MSPKITVGMAHCDDFEGLWATVQSVFLHHEWDSPADVEIVIVDTSPVGSEHRRLVADFVRKGGGLNRGERTPNIKLIDMAGFPGTTKPREEIFTHATGEIVVVMDCHVMLPSNTLPRLVKWFADHPEHAGDLVQGPLVYDSLATLATHFGDQFRGQMWGTWSTAWRTPCGVTFVCEHEAVSDDEGLRQSTGMVQFQDLMTMDSHPGAVATEGGAVMLGDTYFPPIQWAGHERKLVELGCVEIGKLDSDEPFDIPGQGMGLYACRREAWLGYVEHASGFGGEEMNIHLKFRQAGKRSLCLPFLKWNHRFGRAGGAPYPIPLSAKVRNYVLWANHLGIPLDRIERHFVTTGNFGRENWERLVADPLNYPINFQRPAHAGGGAALQPLDQLFAKTAATARDLSEHAETIRDYAARCGSIVGFVKRADWEPMLAHGFPMMTLLYQAEQSGLTEATRQAIKAQSCKGNRRIASFNTIVGPADILEAPAVPCEMLVIDRDNDAGFLSAVLQRHAGEVNRYIMIRGTQSFGEKSELDPTQPGLWQAMQEFLEANPEWFIREHRPNQYGLTVLCCQEAERPERPITPWPKGYGPGTELKRILDSLGIQAPENCGCRATMRAMDDLGVEGCRDQFELIVAKIRENAEKWGWGKLSGLAKLPAAGLKAILSGLAFRVNPLDPIPGVVEQAILAAEADPKCSAKCDPKTCKKPNCKREAVTSG
jgi:hypothetical protein